MSVFGWACVIFPLERCEDPPNDWQPGPWPVFPPGSPESVTIEDRRRRYHATAGIEAVTDPATRAWLSVETDQAGIGAVVRCFELARFRVGLGVRNYLLVHLDMTAGPRGGVSQAMSDLASLSRLESERVTALMTDLASSTRLVCEVDRTYMRAVTVVGLPAVNETASAPLVQDDDRLRAWLTAGTDLPRAQESGYESDGRPDFAVVPGVRGMVGAGGLAVASLGGRHLRERTFRAHYVDAMLIALTQRDALLGIASALATYRAAGLRRKSEIRSAFDEFRAAWWKPVAVDHPVSRVIGDRWRALVGADALMHQMIAEFGDLHHERRATRSELLAQISLLIALAALLVGAIRFP